MKNILLYAGVVAVTLYVAVLYTSDFLRFLLGFEIVLPVILFLSLLYLWKGTSVGLKVRIPVVQRGEEIPVELSLQCRRVLPAPCIRVRLDYGTAFMTRKDRCRFTGMADGRGTTQLVCRVEAAHCGKVDIAVRKARVYDYLRMFSLPVSVSDTVSVNVLPQLYLLDAEVSTQTRGFPVEGEEYDPNKSGQDPAEIFRVREYRAGDSLKMVHWKLSARSEDLLVKEFGQPLGCAVVFFLDLYTGEQGRELSQKQDTLIETAACISYSLLEASCMHAVVWYERTAGLHRRFVRKEEDFYEALDELLAVAPSRENCELTDLYRERFPGEAYATALALNLDGELKKNGELLCTFPRENLRQTLEGYYLLV